MMNHPIGDNEQQFCQQREENEKIMGLLHPIETNWLVIKIYLLFPIGAVDNGIQFFP